MARSRGGRKRTKPLAPFGERIRELIEASPEFQGNRTRFLEAIGYGSKQAQFGRYETGETKRIPGEVVALCASVLHTTTDHLLGDARPVIDILRIVDQQAQRVPQDLRPAAIEELTSQARDGDLRAWVERIVAAEVAARLQEATADPPAPDKRPPARKGSRPRR